MRCSICPPGRVASSQEPDATWFPASTASTAPMALAKQVCGGQAVVVRLDGVAGATLLDRDGDRPGRVERQLGAVTLGVLELGLLVERTGNGVAAARLDAGPAEPAQQVVVLVLEAQDTDRAAARDAGQRHAGHAWVVPDRVTMRAGPGLADHLEHARLEPGGDAHLEGLGLLVNVVPWHPHDLHEERLDQAVAADDVPGHLIALGGQRDALVGTAAHQALATETADHLGHARR